MPKGAETEQIGVAGQGEGLRPGGGVGRKEGPNREPAAAEVEVEAAGLDAAAGEAGAPWGGLTEEEEGGSAAGGVLAPGAECGAEDGVGELEAWGAEGGLGAAGAVGFAAGAGGPEPGFAAVGGVGGEEDEAAFAEAEGGGVAGGGAGVEVAEGEEGFAAEVGDGGLPAMGGGLDLEEEFAAAQREEELRGGWALWGEGGLEDLFEGGGAAVVGPDFEALAARVGGDVGVEAVLDVEELGGVVFAEGLDGLELDFALDLLDLVEAGLFEVAAADGEEGVADAVELVDGDVDILVEDAGLAAGVHGEEVVPAVEGDVRGVVEEEFALPSGEAFEVLGGFVGEGGEAHALGALGASVADVGRKTLYVEGEKGDAVAEALEGEGAYGRLGVGLVYERFCSLRGPVACVGDGVGLFWGGKGTEIEVVTEFDDVF